LASAELAECRSAALLSCFPLTKALQFSSFHFDNLLWIKKMSIESWFVWALLSAIFAAMMTIFAKFGLQRIDPDVGQFLRTAVVLISIGLFVVPSGKLAKAVLWNAQTWTLLTLSGLCTSASWVCYFRALDVGSAARVAAVDKLSVVMVAIMAVIFLGERVESLSWIGITLVTAGLVVISLKN
jgi:bacterial/archaeal transporter family protein